MVTWWSFESEEFNVWIRSYHPNVGRFGKEVKLSVSSHSGSRQAFKLQVVKAALGVAIRVKGMDEETAMEFEAATENESETG